MKQTLEIAQGFFSLILGYNSTFIVERIGTSYVSLTKDTRNMLKYGSLCCLNFFFCRVQQVFAEFLSHSPFIRFLISGFSLTLTNEVFCQVWRPLLTDFSRNQRYESFLWTTSVVCHSFLGTTKMRDVLRGRRHLKILEF